MLQGMLHFPFELQLAEMASHDADGSHLVRCGMHDTILRSDGRLLVWV